MDMTLNDGVRSFVDEALYPSRLKAASAPLLAITAAELLNQELPERETILAPWLPEKGLAMIYGPRGIGKTFLLLSVAYAIATGGTVTRWTTSRPRKVLIIDGEMPGKILQDRLTAVMKKTDLELPAPDYLRFLAMDMQERGLDLSDPNHQDQLEVVIADADVIVVDNLGTLSRGGRENEGESWLPVQDWALRQRRSGRSVIFVHHAGKGGQQRGTSRREDVLDTVISLRRPADYEANQGARFEVHFEKNRGFFGVDAEPFQATLENVGWTTCTLADADTDRVLNLTEGGLTVRDIAEELGMSSSRVGRIQKKARGNGALLTEPNRAGRKGNSKGGKEN
jgi:KaiC/GvpD/RAD55 family RecA-like ATPase